MIRHIGFWKQPAGAADVVVVSGQTISKSSTSPTDAFARLKVDNDGKIYESKDTGTPSWVQIDTVTDWVRPTASAPGLYQVRYTSLVGNVLDQETAAEDVWHALSGGDYILVQSVVGINVHSSTITVEIRLGTGSVLDNATYILAADVDSGK